MFTTSAVGLPPFQTSFTAVITALIDVSCAPASAPPTAHGATLC